MIAAIDEGLLGRELYLAYIADSGGLNYQGKPCPAWSELPQEIRDHWRAVARRAAAVLTPALDG